MPIVRHARAGDTPGILACLDAAFAPYRSAYTDAGYRDTVLDEASLRRRMSTMAIFVAESAGTIVGTIGVGHLDSDVAHLRGMAVAPAQQRSGIGGRLLRRALDEAAVAGCAHVTLDTTAPLAAAARFYEAAGFRRTSHVGDFFGMPLFEFRAPIDRSFSFRDATRGDADAIRDVVNAAYVVEEHFVTGARLGVDELHACFERGAFLVATDRDGQVVACVFLRPEGDRRTYLGLLAVSPRLQGRRLGALMMAAAERRCRGRGDLAIDIRVVNLRTELPPFYRARGFIEIGTAPFEDPRLRRPAHFTVMALEF
jgi:N-acetylglutamate synthase-like GNAT family acetyltransferase